MGVVVKFGYGAPDKQPRTKPVVLRALLSILSRASRSLGLSVLSVSLSIVVGLIPVWRVILRLAIIFLFIAVLIEWADHWSHLQILFPIGSLIVVSTLLYSCSVTLGESEFMARLNRAA